MSRWMPLLAARFRAFTSLVTLLLIFAVVVEIHTLSQRLRRPIL